MATKTLKPKKPHKDFPLTPMTNGQWAKKIKGKLHYFGVWSDPEAALNKYLDQKDDLQAGRIPKRADDARLTIRDLCNHFLTNKAGKVETGELSQRMFHGYKGICERLIEHFGRTQVVEDLRAADFSKLRSVFAKGVGLVTLGNLVQHARIVFKYADDVELISRPLRFGPDFKKPGKRQLRTERQSKPVRLFQADELRRIIAKANQPLKAMALLGINCAFGQTDCSMLPMKALDLDGGWINFPRPKTAVERRCPLWSETVTAIREALEIRRIPKAEQFADRVFINTHGLEYVRFQENGTNLNGISLQFGKLLRSLNLSGNGRSFYAMRHTFETIGGGTLDQIAIDAIMGHAPHSNDMGAVYRQNIDDSRLRAVTDHVRNWLWPAEREFEANHKTKAANK